MPHFTTDVYLHTNTSVYKIPLYVYHGRLKVSRSYLVCGGGGGGMMSFKMSNLV